MRTSDSIDLLAAALAKAQGEMQPASKDSINPHFKSKYADLASAWAAAQGPLSRNGLALAQAFGRGENRDTVIDTRLMHTSGQWIESSLTIYNDSQKPMTPQQLGSCITYYRRYSQMAILNIVPDDDDDGNLASASRDPSIPRAPVGPERFDMHNEQHKATFKAMLKAQFPNVPETLYRTLAQVCHGKPADSGLAVIVGGFLAKHEGGA